MIKRGLAVLVAAVTVASCNPISYTIATPSSGAFGGVGNMPGHGDFSTSAADLISTTAIDMNTNTSGGFMFPVSAWPSEWIAAHQDFTAELRFEAQGTFITDANFNGTVEGGRLFVLLPDSAVTSPFLVSCFFACGAWDFSANAPEWQSLNLVGGQYVGTFPTTWATVTIPIPSLSYVNIFNWNLFLLFDNRSPEMPATAQIRNVEIVLSAST